MRSVFHLVVNWVVLLAEGMAGTKAALLVVMMVACLVVMSAESMVAWMVASLVLSTVVCSVER